MRKRVGILCYIFLMVRTYAVAQSYFYNDRYFEPRWLIEGGVLVGSMNCLTDLGGSSGNNRAHIKDLNLGNTRFVGGCFVQATSNHSLGFRIQFCRGSIRGHDSILNKKRMVPGSRLNRNLHFASIISELSFLTELSPEIFLTTREKSGKVQWYLLAGFSLFHFNPKAKLNGNWISLQPLHTEGQGLSLNYVRDGYALTQWSVPLGAGVRVEVNPKFHLRFEMITRILFTDYIDDVSTNYVDPQIFFQYLPVEKAILAKALADRRIKEPNQASIPGEMRGNPDNNDTFFHFSVSISYLFNRKLK